MNNIIERHYEGIGGQLNKKRQYYFDRLVDKQLLDTLKDRRSFITIIAPRQVGKTSLCISVAEQLEKYNEPKHNTVFIDLGSIFGYQSNEQTKSREGWFSILFRKIAEQASASTTDEVNQWIEKQQTGFGVATLIDFFTDFIRPKVTGPINFFFDEVDVILHFHTFTDDFFYGLSRLANNRSELDISIVFIGVTPVSELLKISDASTFSNCENIVLNDFNEESIIADWVKPLALNNKQAQEIGNQVYIETGGQPYLTSFLFSRIVEKNATTATQVEAIAVSFVEGLKNRTEFSAHFKYHKESLERLTSSGAIEALELFGQLRQQSTPYEALQSDLKKAADLLLRIGMTRIGLDVHLKCKGLIHSRYMNSDWIKDCKQSIGVRPNSNYQLRSINDNSKIRAKICIINIGGMINMERRPDGSIGEPSDLGEYLSDIPELFELADFVSIALFSKDSSEVTPSEWSEVARAIYTRKGHGYSGFVITGGTDTLPNIASALAFALGPGLRFPIICTGAQVSRQVWHGDARINLIRACKLATFGKKLPEVLILSNDTGLRAVRTEKKDDYRFDAFHSPTIEPIAAIADQITIAKHIRTLPPRRVPLTCEDSFETNIFKIQFYPGLKSEFILPILEIKHLKGLIIETPGIGVLPMEGDFSLAEVLHFCRKNKIPVLLLSLHPTQANLAVHYEPAQGVVMDGILTAPNISPTAATVKFMWLLAQIQQRIDSKDLNEEDKISELFYEMKSDYVGELDEKIETTENNTNKY